MQPKARYVQTVEMGLGDAVKRLIAVEFQFRVMGESATLLEERRLLLEAMNHVPIQIGFDCQGDGVPEDVEIFKQAATTSCCRLMPYESSKEAPKPKKAATNSRRQEAKPGPSPVEAPVSAPTPSDPPVSTSDPTPKKKGFLGIFGKDK